MAVLPFENLSQDPGQEYFSDGIAEDVIAALGRFSNLLLRLSPRASNLKVGMFRLPISAAFLMCVIFLKAAFAGRLTEFA